jgi:pimeloyl-ACP methyl ester carboxylesterase
MSHLHITLSDHRSLAYSDTGDPSGSPILYMHGLPSCRLSHPDEELSRALGVRVITPDRPGFGRSDPRPGRSLLDWADDAAELADALSLDRFAVVGVSGGGPPALACAHALGGRVTAAAVLGGSGPITAPGAMEGMAIERRAGYWLARNTPGLFRQVVGWRGDPRRDPEAFHHSFTRHNPASDQAILSRPGVKQRTMASYAEATRQGLDAFVWEVQLVARDWGFELSDIEVPTWIWHGAEDNSTPVGMARAMARSIPGAELRIVEGIGHMLAAAHWDDVARALMGTGTSG